MNRATKRQLGLAGWLIGGLFIAVGYLTSTWQLSLFGVAVGALFGIVWRLHL